MKGEMIKYASPSMEIAKERNYKVSQMEMPTFSFRIGALLLLPKRKYRQGKSWVPGYRGFKS